jgi:hypothetical protein
MAKRAGSRPSDDDRGSKRVEPTRPAPSSGQPTAPAPPTVALALFQRGMEALQRHAYTDAATAFDAVVMGFPHERGLLDRARVYLELCARESVRRPAGPKTIEERLTAATAALNNDDDAAAEDLARSVLGDDPKHDLALYLLAAVFARRGSIADALDFLGRAIALSPEASTQARTDDDFTSLHDEDAFWTLTEPPIVPAGTRRPRARG